MNRHLFVSVSLVFSLVMFAPQVQAQSSASAEQREAKAYRLTMEKINRFAAATKSLRKLASSDPKACSAVNRDDEDEGGSLDEQAKRIEAAYPKAVPVLKAQGLTVREFLLLTAVQLQAGLAAHAKSMGMKELPPDVNPENVAFMEQHKKELDAITADLKKVSDPCAQNDDEEDSQ